MSGTVYIDMSVCVIHHIGFLHVLTVSYAHALPVVMCIDAVPTDCMIAVCDDVSVQ